MSNDLSPAEKRLLWVLTGEMPPGLDENRIWRRADVYASAGRKVRDAGPLLADGVSRVRKGAKGRAGDAFLNSMEQYLAKDPSFLDSSAQIFQRLERSTRSAGTSVEYMKLQIYAGAIEVILEFLTAAAMAVVSWVKLAELAAKIAVLKALIQALANQVAKNVVVNQVVSTTIQVLMDAAVQRLQLNRGTRGGWDYGLTRNSAVIGSVTGVVSSVVGPATAGTAGKLFRGRMDDIVGPGTDLVPHRPPTRRDTAADIGEETVAGAAGESLGEGFASLALGGGFDVGGPMTLAAGAISEGGSAVAGKIGAANKNRIHDALGLGGSGGTGPAAPELVSEPAAGGPGGGELGGGEPGGGGSVGTVPGATGPTDPTIVGPDGPPAPGAVPNGSAPGGPGANGPAPGGPGANGPASGGPDVNVSGEAGPGAGAAPGGPADSVTGTGVDAASVPESRPAPESGPAHSGTAPGPDPASTPAHAAPAHAGSAPAVQPAGAPVPGILSVPATPQTLAGAVGGLPRWDGNPAGCVDRVSAVLTGLGRPPTRTRDDASGQRSTDRLGEQVDGVFQAATLDALRALQPGHATVLWARPSSELPHVVLVERRPDGSLVMVETQPHSPESEFMPFALPERSDGGPVPLPDPLRGPIRLPLKGSSLAQVRTSGAPAAPRLAVAPRGSRTLDALTDPPIGTEPRAPSKKRAKKVAPPAAPPPPPAVAPPPPPAAAPPPPPATAPPAASGSATPARRRTQRPAAPPPPTAAPPAPPVIEPAKLTPDQLAAITVTAGEWVKGQGLPADRQEQARTIWTSRAVDGAAVLVGHGAPFDVLIGYGVGLLRDQMSNVLDRSMVSQQCARLISELTAARRTRQLLFTLNIATGTRVVANPAAVPHIERSDSIRKALLHPFMYMSFHRVYLPFDWLARPELATLWDSDWTVRAAAPAYFALAYSLTGPQADRTKALASITEVLRRQVPILDNSSSLGVSVNLDSMSDPTGFLRSLLDSPTLMAELNSLYEWNNSAFEQLTPALIDGVRKHPTVIPALVATPDLLRHVTASPDLLTKLAAAPKLVELLATADQAARMSLASDAAELRRAAEAEASGQTAGPVQPPPDEPAGKYDAYHPALVQAIRRWSPGVWWEPWKVANLTWRLNKMSFWGPAIRGNRALFNFFLEHHSSLVGSQQAFVTWAGTDELALALFLATQSNGPVEPSTLVRVGKAGDEVLRLMVHNPALVAAVVAARSTARLEQLATSSAGALGRLAELRHIPAMTRWMWEKFLLDDTTPEARLDDLIVALSAADPAAAVETLMAGAPFAVTPTGILRTPGRDERYAKLLAGTLDEMKATAKTFPPEKDRDSRETAIQAWQTLHGPDQAENENRQSLVRQYPQLGYALLTNPSLAPAWQRRPGLGWLLTGHSLFELAGDRDFMRALKTSERLFVELRDKRQFRERVRHDPVFRKSVLRNIRLLEAASYYELVTNPTAIDRLGRMDLPPTFATALGELGQDSELLLSAPDDVVRAVLANPTLATALRSDRTLLDLLSKNPPFAAMLATNTLTVDASRWRTIIGLPADASLAGLLAEDPDFVAHVVAGHGIARVLAGSEQLRGAVRHRPLRNFLIRNWDAAAPGSADPIGRLVSAEHVARALNANRSLREAVTAAGPGQQLLLRAVHRNPGLAEAVAGEAPIRHLRQRTTLLAALAANDYGLSAAQWGQLLLAPSVNAALDKGATFADRLLRLLRDHPGPLDAGLGLRFRLVDADASEAEIAGILAQRDEDRSGPAPSSGPETRNTGPGPAPTVDPAPAPVAPSPSAPDPAPPPEDRTGGIVEAINENPVLFEVLHGGKGRAAADAVAHAIATTPEALSVLTTVTHLLDTPPSASDLSGYSFEKFLEGRNLTTFERDLAEYTARISAYQAPPIRAAVEALWLAARHRQLAAEHAAALARHQRLTRFDPNRPDTWEVGERVHFTRVAEAAFTDLQLVDLRRTAADLSGLREKSPRANQPLHRHLDGGSSGASVAFVLNDDGFVDLLVYAKSVRRNDNNDYDWGFGFTGGPLALSRADGSAVLSRSLELVSAQHQPPPEPSTGPARETTAAEGRRQAVSDLAAALVDYHAEYHRPGRPGLTAAREKLTRLGIDVPEPDGDPRIREIDGVDVRHVPRSVPEWHSQLRFADPDVIARVAALIAGTVNRADDIVALQEFVDEVARLVGVEPPAVILRRNNGGSRRATFNRHDDAIVVFGTGGPPVDLLLTLVHEMVHAEQYAAAERIPVGERDDSQLWTDVMSDHTDPLAGVNGPVSSQRVLNAYAAAPMEASALQVEVEVQAQLATGGTGHGTGPGEPETGPPYIRVPSDGLCLLHAVALAAPRLTASLSTMPGDAHQRLLAAQEAGLVVPGELADITLALRDHIRESVRNPGPEMTALLASIGDLNILPRDRSVNDALIDAIDNWDAAWRTDVATGNQYVDASTGAGTTYGDLFVPLIGAALGHSVDLTHMTGDLATGSSRAWWATGEPIRLIYRNGNHFDAAAPLRLPAQVPQPSQPGPTPLPQPADESAPNLHPAGPNQWLVLPAGESATTAWAGSAAAAARRTAERLAGGDPVIVARLNTNGVVDAPSGGWPPGRLLEGIASALNPGSQPVGRFMLVLSGDPDMAGWYAGMLQHELRRRADDGRPTPDGFSLVVIGGSGPDLEPQWFPVGGPVPGLLNPRLRARLVDRVYRFPPAVQPPTYEETADEPGSPTVGNSVPLPDSGPGFDRREWLLHGVWPQSPHTIEVDTGLTVEYRTIPLSGSEHDSGLDVVILTDGSREAREDPRTLGHVLHLWENDVNGVKTFVPVEDDDFVLKAMSGEMIRDAGSDTRSAQARIRESLGTHFDDRHGFESALDALDDLAPGANLSSLPDNHQVRVLLREMVRGTVYRGLRDFAATVGWEHAGLVVVLVVGGTVSRPDEFAGRVVLVPGEPAYTGYLNDLAPDQMMVSPEIHNGRLRWLVSGNVPNGPAFELTFRRLHNALTVAVLLGTPPSPAERDRILGRLLAGDSLDALTFDGDLRSLFDSGLLLTPSGQTDVPVPREIEATSDDLTDAINHRQIFAVDLRRVDGTSRIISTAPANVRYFDIEENGVRRRIVLFSATGGSWEPTGSEALTTLLNARPGAVVRLAMILGPRGLRARPNGRRGTRRTVPMPTVRPGELTALLSGNPQQPAYLRIGGRASPPGPRLALPPSVAAGQIPHLSGDTLIVWPPAGQELVVTVPPDSADPTRDMPGIVIEYDEPGTHLTRDGQRMDAEAYVREVLPASAGVIVIFARPAPSTAVVFLRALTGRDIGVVIPDGTGGWTAMSHLTTEQFDSSADAAAALRAGYLERLLAAARNGPADPLLAGLAFLHLLPSVPDDHVFRVLPAGMTVEAFLDGLGADGLVVLEPDGQVGPDQHIVTVPGRLLRQLDGTGREIVLKGQSTDGPEITGTPLYQWVRSRFDGGHVPIDTNLLAVLDSLSSASTISGQPGFTRIRIPDELATDLITDVRSDGHAPRGWRVTGSTTEMYVDPRIRVRRIDIGGANPFVAYVLEPGPGGATVDRIDGVLVVWRAGAELPASVRRRTDLTVVPGGGSLRVTATGTVTNGSFSAPVPTGGVLVIAGQNPASVLNAVARHNPPIDLGAITAPVTVAYQIRRLGLTQWQITTVGPGAAPSEVQSTDSSSDLTTLLLRHLTRPLNPQPTGGRLIPLPAEELVGKPGRDTPILLLRQGDTRPTDNVFDAPGNACYDPAETGLDEGEVVLDTGPLLTGGRSRSLGSAPDLIAGAVRGEHDASTTAALARMVVAAGWAAPPPGAVLHLRVPPGWSFGDRRIAHFMTVSDRPGSARVVLHHEVADRVHLMSGPGQPTVLVVPDPEQLIVVPYRDGPVIRLRPQPHDLPSGPAGVLFEPGRVSGATIDVGPSATDPPLTAQEYAGRLPATPDGPRIAVLLDPSARGSEFGRALVAEGVVVVLPGRQPGEWETRRRSPLNGEVVTSTHTDLDSALATAGPRQQIDVTLAALIGGPRVLTVPPDGPDGQRIELPPWHSTLRLADPQVAAQVAELMDQVTGQWSDPQHDRIALLTEFVARVAHLIGIRTPGLSVRWAPAGQGFVFDPDPWTILVPPLGNSATGHLPAIVQLLAHAEQFTRATDQPDSPALTRLRQQVDNMDRPRLRRSAREIRNDVTGRQLPAADARHLFDLVRIRLAGTGLVGTLTPGQIRLAYRHLSAQQRNGSTTEKAGRIADWLRQNT